MNKLSRLAALLLTLLMLLSCAASAETGSDGIAIEDLDTATYQLLLSEAAETSEEGAGEETYPEPLVQCTDSIYGKECLLDELRTMTAEERCAAVNAKESYYYSHYRTYHEETELLCECDFPMPAPGAEGHIFDNCPWHPDNYVPEVDTDLGDIETDGICVTGDIPAGTEISVTTPDMTDIDVFEQGLKGMMNAYTAIDVTLTDASGEEWQPESGKTLSVTMDVSGIGKAGDRVNVYHVHGEPGAQTLQIIEAGTIDDDGNVSFSVNNFSYLLAVNMSVDGGTVSAPAEPIVPDLPEQPALGNGVYTYASAGSADLSSGAATIDLPKSGKATLSVAESGGQWQVLVGEQWVDVNGETGATFEVTYAKIAMLGSSAQIRWISADGETTSETATINVVEPVQTAAEEDAMYYAANSLNVMPLAEGDEVDPSDKKTYSIVINYQFEDGSTAAESYTAVLAEGSNFTATVKLPVIQGYLPYDEENVQLTKPIELQYQNISADDTITVVYKPALVNYTVIYYQQNLNDDDYTEYERETKQGLTKSIVGEVTKTYEGFQQLLYERPAIAADGSTVVEVYYDRLYYLMNFDLGGGYGVDPIYARYDAEIGTVDEPDRPGYDFMGWARGDGVTVVELPETMPAENRTYKAVWQVGDPVDYTVVYWKENADDAGYTYWGQVERTALVGTIIDGSDDIPTSITTTTVDGSQLNERPYFTYNDARTDKNVEVKGDGSTVVNVYYYRNTYTIYFEGIIGTCAIEEHTHGTNCNSFLDCPEIEHTHGEDCSRILTCDIDEHEHVDACTGLVCTIPVHSEHTDDCLVCTKPVHEQHDAECCTIEEHPTHSDDCCTIEEHVHTDTCCTTTEHTHSDDCCEYGGTSRNHRLHSDNCCTEDLTAHEHGDGECTYDHAQHTHNDGSCDHEQPLHTHGGSSCVCETEIHYHSDDQNCYSDKVHSHDDSCYGFICDQAAHAHSEACYSYTCGGEEHTHSEDCYRPCTKREHTHGNNCDNNSDNNVIYVVTAKYEQNIADVWPTAENFPNITFRGWSIDGQGATAVSKRVNMTSDLCDTSDNLKYADAVTGGSKTYLYYMFESFDQTSPADGTERIFRNGTYYDLSEEYYQEVNSSGDWNQKEIYGMNPVNNGVVESGSNVFLYYTRNRSVLSYHNVNGIVKTVGNIMYEQPLENYRDADGNLLSAYVPPYPSTLEANAYEFKGWYTTPECYDGTEFDFATATMPNGDLTIYAKWVPVNRTVEFYLTEQDVDGEKLYEDAVVPHGSIIDPIPEQPVNGNYEFVGWFYRDTDGKEKAINFENLQIRKNMQVYAKWRSNTLMEYIVFYKDRETGEEIAAPLEGSKLAGETITFEAKGGDELYEGYQVGYFPVVKSHSMTVEIIPGSAIDADEAWYAVVDESGNPVLNEDGTQKYIQSYTFWYNPEDAVPYTVKYINTETGTSVFTVDGVETSINDKIVSDNRNAVVTETFLKIKGYMPDAYQKRLVVSTEEGAVNEIIFYYTKDDKRAYYTITHYTENLVGEDWSVYQTDEFIGDIGSLYTAESIDIPGFTYDPDVTGTLTSGTLTADGLELKLYYVRNEYPYIVRYLEKDTGKTLADPKDSTGLYGDTVVEESILIENYTLVSDPTQSLVIRIDEIVKDADGNIVTPPTYNVITFYYTENDATINYVVVGPDGCGTVTPTSETVKVVTGDAIGSTAAASSTDYKFVGWYSDAACTQLVSTDAKFVPTQPGRTTAEDGSVKYGLWPETTTYYAKFEWNVTSLTITKAGLNLTLDPNASTMFTITGANGFSMTVVVKGNSSVTINNLLVGTYTVTELTDWSWRYTADKTYATVDAKGGQTNSVTFTNTRTNDQWLDAEASAENVFTGVTTE